MKATTTKDLKISPTTDFLLKVQAPVKSESNQSWFYLIAALFIAIATVAVYRPTLFNFFISDDFSMIIWMNTWLKDAKSLLLIAQQFCQPWMMNPSHYRPLIGAIWALEYSLWGANGICFRLSSIVFMLLSSFVLGLIIFEMSKKSMAWSSQPRKVLPVWIILSGALFALYPLHCEPINWCVCQHDVLVTLFCF